MILLNYTDFCVFLFSNLVFYSFFVFGGKFTTSISTFATPVSNFRAFSLKNDFYWLLDFTNVRAQLFPDRQFSFYILMKIETTRLQQSITFNLHSVTKYNKHLFTIKLIIHVFAIFHSATDIYIFFIYICFVLVSK